MPKKKSKPSLTKNQISAIVLAAEEEINRYVYSAELNDGSIVADAFRLGGRYAVDCIARMVEDWAND